MLFHSSAGTLGKKMPIMPLKLSVPLTFLQLLCMLLHSIKKGQCKTWGQYKNNVGSHAVLHWPAWNALCIRMGSLRPNRICVLVWHFARSHGKVSLQVIKFAPSPSAFWICFNKRAAIRVTLSWNSCSESYGLIFRALDLWLLINI